MDSKLKNIIGDLILTFRERTKNSKINYTIPEIRPEYLEMQYIYSKESYYHSIYELLLSIRDKINRIKEPFTEQQIEDFKYSTILLSDLKNLHRAEFDNYLFAIYKVFTEYETQLKKLNK